jgi:hypothetical protein
VHPSLETMRRWLAALEHGVAHNERTAIQGVLHAAVPDFRGAAA